MLTKAGRRVYRPALYNLKDDPFEKKDVAADHPDNVSEMKARIEKAMQPLP